MKKITNKSINGSVIDITDDYIQGIVTAEVVDGDGDLVLVDGIDLSRQSPNSPLKLLPSHCKDLSNGMPAVLGVVTDLWKDYTITPDGEKVKALFFKAKWGDSDIASAWKKEYKDKNLDSFSIGAVPITYSKIETGICFEESQIAEISCVAVPSNPLATVTVSKNLSKYLKEDYIMEINKSATPASYPALQSNNGSTDQPGINKDDSTMVTMSLKDLKDHHDAIKKCFTKSMDDMTCALKDHLTKCHKDLSDNIGDRLDGIESDISELSDPDEDTEDQEVKTASNKSIKKLDLSAVEKALNDLKKIIS